MSAQFARTAHPTPLPHAQRAEILADAGFGQYFTDHMVTIRWTAGRGAGTTRRCVPYGPLTLDPATMVLHYGQEIFEGLKAYRQPDGSIASFRPGRERRPVPRLGGAAGDAGAARRAVPRLARGAARRRPRVGAAGRRRGVAVPAAVHVRHRGRARRAAVGRVPVLRDRLAGRAVLPGRREAGRRVAVHRVHARRARAAPARPSAAATTRPRCSRRRRAPSTAASRWSASTPRSAAGSTRWARRTCSSCYGSGDQVEVVTPALTGSILAGRHPRLAAGAGQGAGLPGHRAPHLRATSGSRARPTAGSPRSSAAAPRR